MSANALEENSPLEVTPQTEDSQGKEDVANANAPEILGAGDDNTSLATKCSVSKQKPPIAVFDTSSWISEQTELQNQAVSKEMISELITPTDSSPPRYTRGRVQNSSSLNRPRHRLSTQQLTSVASRQSLRELSPVRTEFGDDIRDAGGEEDAMSMRSAMSTRTLRAARPRPVTKSQKISSIQNIFTESQKIAYVGLCYLSIVQRQRKNLKSLRKANESYTQWAEAFMEKLYVFLDIKPEERSMIKSLSEHGLVPSDLSKTLIEDAQRAARVVTERQESRQRAEEEALEKGLPFEFDSANDNDDSADQTDIRYTVLSHLFILCIMDGQYDSRSRTVLRSVAGYLEVPWLDVVRLEEAIASQLRIYEDSEAVTSNVQLVGKRNEADTKKRWLFTGLATLAGGAVIGLTAGLAAPLIAGGIGVALGTFGVTGATAALSTTGALALITTGGVLTGSGMGGFKMMKRTRGITQFEFMTLADGIRQIEENKEKRRTERRKKRRREARVALQEKIDQQRADQSEKTHDAKGDSKGESVDGALQGTKGDSVEKVPPEKKEVTAKQSEEEDLPPYAAPTNEKLDRIGNWVKITDSQRANLGKMDGDPAPVRVPPPVPSRPTAAELADMTEQRHLAATAPRKPQRKPSELSLTKLNGEAGHVWGLEEGFNWPDHEGQASEDPLDVGVDSGMDSTVLWDSNNQLNSDGESLARSSHEDLRFDKGSLDDVGTIDEDMAACMFDDLQSTVDGDNDEDFRFREPEGPPKAKQTNVLITVAGWITYGADDHTLPFSTLEADLAGDQYALIWETDTLQELGSALRLLVGEVASFLVQQGLQATVLSALMIGLAGPLWVMKLSYLVDNPWGIGLSKANKAGKVLADTLIQGVQENRPVTLIGYSLGARVIFHCLLELAARGAHGLVEEVYLLGCPVMAQKKEWEQISSVVAGRVVNGYATNDMVLGVLYRASVAVWNNVAGLRPVEGVDGIENIALDDVIQGHLDYRLCMPKVLEKLGFSITRDYFDDEDEEEEKERLELEEEKKREKEERLRAKEQRLQKKQEEYEEKLRKKKEEQERKLLERQERDKLKEEARLKRLEEKAAEAALAATSATASTSRMSWFSRRSSGKTTPVIEKPEEIEQLMDDYWMPKEIRSTLPPLVIAQDADEVFTPKELKATLPPLVIRTQELIEASHSATSTPQSKLSTTAEGDRDELIAAEIELEKAQAEVEAAKSEVAQARAAADAAAEAVAHHHHHHPISTTSPKEASDCIDTGLPAVDATELERAMMAAGPPASAGAGDLLDSKRDDDDDEDDDEAPVTALASPPFEDECTATVWHEDTPELQSPFADEIIRNLSSPGLASLTSSDATTSSPGAFVDAEENPWSG